MKDAFFDMTVRDIIPNSFGRELKDPMNVG